MVDQDSLRAELESAPVVAVGASPSAVASAAPDAAPGAANGTGAPEPAPGGAGDGGKKKGRPRGEIFRDCPVVPLGVYGDVSYYLDRLGQLRAIDNHSLDKIRHVFGGDVRLLSMHFPQYDKDGDKKPGKFDQASAAAVMTEASAERGVWSPVGRVRGAGAWADDDGSLIYHAGDEVLIGGRWLRPGVYAGHVYPASDPVPRPAPTARGDAAGEALALISTWAWRRPDIDPQLALGVACAQMMGGALDWRPVGWLTGDAATGKSTFQKFLLWLHGGEAGLLQAADATEAGIRSVVGYSSLPVAVDELEPDKDNPRKVKAVIELARRAASGGQIFRGGADQKGHQSNAQSAFLFSSILVPPMPAQDRSRLILLDLNQLPPDAPKISLDPRKWRGVGAQIRRALIEGWPTWPARLELWRATLARHGQTGRGADNFATVLAMADMAMRSDMPGADELNAWARKVSHASTEDALEVGSNADDMLMRLMGQPLDVWRRGRKFTVGQWVAMAARMPGARDAIDEATPDTANQFLAPYGLRVRGRGSEAALCIANRPLALLSELFKDSPWAEGVWSQAARRLPGAKATPPLHFAGASSRAWEVPLAGIPGLLQFPADRDDGQNPAAPPGYGLPSDAEDFV
jgi:hypothetical protein